MTTVKGLGVLIAAWVGLTAAISGYMTYIRAPSVVAIRPEITEVGFWAALFSGRFGSWLFHHSPVAGTTLMGLLIGLAALAALHDT